MQRVKLGNSHFNSRPHGGRQLAKMHNNYFGLISTHALTEGDRRRSHAGHCVEAHFNSRPHGGRRTHGQKHREKRTISTHALTEGDPSRNSSQFVQRISTHALTEGDNPRASCSATASSISTHALTEGDRARPALQRLLQISTHALTEGDPNTAVPPLIQSISTHALTEGDSTELISSRYSYSFQLTPSRRATIRGFRFRCFFVISTHALTEGDGKFRQIFLLNRGYAYSISLYFLPHFISLLPQILSFQQKSFKFQVRIFLLFSVHLAFALQNQCVHHVKYRFCTNMFYFVFVLFTQIVKPQTIGLFIYDFF